MSTGPDRTAPDATGPDRADADALREQIARALWEAIDCSVPWDVITTDPDFAGRARLYRSQADAALSVFRPVLEQRDAEIERLEALVSADPIAQVRADLRALAGADRARARAWDEICVQIEPAVTALAQRAETAEAERDQLKAAVDRVTAILDFVDSLYDADQSATGYTRVRFVEISTVRTALDQPEGAVR